MKGRFFLMVAVLGGSCSTEVLAADPSITVGVGEITPRSDRAKGPSPTHGLLGLDCLQRVVSDSSPA